MTESRSSSSDSSTDPRIQACAAEVVTLLGDSATGVIHLRAPRSTSPRRSALLLFAAGVLLLGCASFGFARGVANAAANRQAFETWTQVDQLPAHQFRPRRLGPAYDGLAFGGLFGGLLALGLGCWRWRSGGARSTFTVGRDGDADFASPSAPATRFPLVRHEGHRIAVTVPPEMTATLHRSTGVVAGDLLLATGVATPATAVTGGYQIAVPEDGAVHIAAGPTRFIIRSTPAPRVGLGLLAAHVDRRAGRFLAASAIGHLALVVLLSTIPADPRTLVLDLGSRDGRMTVVHTRPSDSAVTAVASGLGEVGDGHSQSRVPGQVGLAGTPDSAGTSGSTKIKNNGQDPTLARAQAMAYARDAGIAGALRRSSNLFESMYSYAAFSSGSDHYDQWGLGDDDGWSRGEFGHGPRGFGPGNGDNGDLIRIGDYDTDPGDDGSVDPGPHRLRQHQAAQPAVQFSDAVVSGGLDKAIIGRYVKRHRESIRYCYERELLANPELAGTATASFLIDGNGAVIYSRTSGVGDAGLEGCIDGAIKRIRFPRSDDGASVNVTYPFHFHQAGR